VGFENLFALYSMQVCKHYKGDVNVFNICDDAGPKLNPYSSKQIS
jgi:hypothetical protein